MSLYVKESMATIEKLIADPDYPNEITPKTENNAKATVEEDWMNEIKYSIKNYPLFKFLKTEN